ncbi:uncharacterized protein PHALS_15198 [Plasmopara halstedii]|uniref:Uncharacterized protein n=1 Tax=Plasmopara halstedii TaxID=4781 RepID=A0A0N7L885_PLAHL|nr:uncharacterized protein PHALS_15198 [Plasmopara halstedii]CEG49171.1 hypothetical protein PHALS_15198 [Plasmopara halstedii]|eukprot:XP_024585540.1 hypothetical protein PHALS_15198 [Plasmopara halstedii]
MPTPKFHRLNSISRRACECDGDFDVYLTVLRQIIHIWRQRKGRYVVSNMLRNYTGKHSFIN